jgi:hypothetical protein
MRKKEMIWCETVDCEPANMIKSGEHRFAPELYWLPRRFALKGKDFS